MQPAETRLSVQSPPVNLISAQNINKIIYIRRDITIIVSLVNAALKLDKPAFCDQRRTAALQQEGQTSATCPDPSSHPKGIRVRT